MSRAAVAGLLALVGVAWTHRVESAPSAIPTPEIQTLSNGLRVAIVRRPGLPMVQITLAVRAGTAVELPAEAGAAQIVRDLLTLGTTSRSAIQFASGAARLGGAVSTSLTREHAFVVGMFPTSALGAGLDLISDAVVHPLFLETDVEGYKRRAETWMERRDLGAMADGQAWAGAFAGHPYARPALPPAEGLRRLGRQHLRNFHQRSYDPRRAILVIEGDVTADRAFADASEWFSRWESRQDSEPGRPIPPPVARRAVWLVDQPQAQRAEIRVVFRAPGRGAEDEAAFAVAAAAMGPGSRSAAALAFPPGARRLDAALEGAGICVLGGAVRPDSARAAVERILTSARDLAAAPPAAIERARRAARFERMAQIEPLAGFAARWAEGAIEGQPDRFLSDHLERMSRVSTEDVKQAAKRWFDPDHAIVVVVGPAESLGELSTLGEVRTVDASRMDEPAVRERPAATAEQVAEGSALVRKAITAHGGLAKLRAAGACTIEADATLYARGSELSGRIVQVRKDPYRLAYTTSFGGKDKRQILDGTRGWSQETASGTPTVKDLSEQEVAGMRRVFEADPTRILLACAAEDVEAVAIGTSSIEDREVHSVEIRRPDGTRWVAHLEAKTFLLAALDQPDDNDARASSRSVYGDYRSVGGVRWPHTEARFLGDERVMRMTATRIVPGAAEDRQFQQPIMIEPAPRR